MSKNVDRTLDFIELFARERKPLSLSEISRSLAIPVSSCHDVLQALRARGYIYEVGPRAGFYPTTSLLNLASSIAQYDPIVERAEIVLKKLRDDVDELVSLAVAADAKATYLLVFEPSHSLRFLVEVGSEVRSLHDVGGQGGPGLAPAGEVRRLPQASETHAAHGQVDHDQDAAARGYRGGAPPRLVPQSRRECRGRHNVVVLLQLERLNLHRDDCWSGGAR